MLGALDEVHCFVVPLVEFVVGTGGGKAGEAGEADCDLRGVDQDPGNRDAVDCFAGESVHGELAVRLELLEVVGG